MSDENEDKTKGEDKTEGEGKKEGKGEGWTGALGGVAGPFAKIMAAMNHIESSMNAQKTKFAIDLAPGDVIKIGHRSVFLVGVNLRELDNPATHDAGLMVQAAGAEAWYQSNDWTWMSQEIMYDSPFLRFHPGQEIAIERESPSGTNTLDQLIAMREKLHKEVEEKRNRWKDAESGASKWGTWAWEAMKEDAYSSKVKEEKKGSDVESEGESNE